MKNISLYTTHRLQQPSVTATRTREMVALVSFSSLVTLASRQLRKAETAASEPRERSSTMTSSRALISRDPEVSARWETWWRWPTATRCAVSEKQVPVAGGPPVAVPVRRRRRCWSDPGDAGTSTATRQQRRRRRLAGVRRCSNRKEPEREVGRRHESAEMEMVHTDRLLRLERRWLGKRRRQDHTAKTVLGAGVCPSSVDFETISVHQRHQRLTINWRCCLSYRRKMCKLQLNFTCCRSIFGV